MGRWRRVPRVTGLTRRLTPVGGPWRQRLSRTKLWDRGGDAAFDEEDHVGELRLKVVYVLGSGPRMVRTSVSLG